MRNDRTARVARIVATLAWLGLSGPLADADVHCGTISSGAAFRAGDGSWFNLGQVFVADLSDGGTTVVQVGVIACLMSDPCTGYVLADCNCDGEVDAFDISAFVLALTNPAGYQSAYPFCARLCVADVAPNGAVDAFDIAAFIDILTGAP